MAIGLGAPLSLDLCLEEEDSATLGGIVSLLSSLWVLEPYGLPLIGSPPPNIKLANTLTVYIA